VRGILTRGVYGTRLRVWFWGSAPGVFAGRVMERQAAAGGGSRLGAWAGAQRGGGPPRLGGGGDGAGAGAVVRVRGDDRAPRAGCPARARSRWRSTYDWRPAVRIREPGSGRLRLGGISLLVAVIPVPNSDLRGQLGVVLPRMLPQKILIETKLRPL
jgi:hypothetical protein